MSENVTVRKNARRQSEFTPEYREHKKPEQKTDAQAGICTDLQITNQSCKI